MDFMYLNTGFLLTGFDYIVILCTYIILIQKPGIIGEGTRLGFSKHRLPEFVRVQTKEAVIYGRGNIYESETERFTGAAGLI